MPSVRTLAPALALSLVLAACGDGGVSKSPASTTAAATSPSGSDLELSDEFCALLDESEAPDGLVDAAPEAVRDGVAALVEMGKTMEAADGAEPGTEELREVADALGADGVGEQLTQLGAAAEEQCGGGEGVGFITTFGVAAGLVGAEADADYCQALETSVVESDGAPNPDEFLDLAPEAHRELLPLLDELSKDDLDPETTSRLAGVLMGLGLYAEARCEIPDAFATLAIAAAFLGMAGEDGLGDATGEGEATAADQPSAADPGPANAAVPGGNGLSFEVVDVALEDDRYLVSVVAPIGWEQSDSFGVTFEPPTDAGMSIFNELSVDTGCDGMCEPNDWEARLRGPDGYLTQILENNTVVEDRSVTGSDGVVVTTRADSGDVGAYVLRWDDTRSKYFRCSVSLDADQADWLPAFVAACESARPGWLTVS